MARFFSVVAVKIPKQKRFDRDPWNKGLEIASYVWITTATGRQTDIILSDLYFDIVPTGVHV